MGYWVIKNLYTLIFILALPWVMLRLWWRGFKTPAYRQRWLQRFGLFPNTITQPSIWLHAVSVGEVRAAALLVEAILEQYPDVPVVVTTTTPTGYEQAVQLLGGRVHLGHLPYDIPLFVNVFLKRIQPKIGIIMERELWPNLFCACQGRNLPLMMANARLPDKSLRKYQRFLNAVTQMLSALPIIAVVSEKDAVNFEILGVNRERLVVTGNLKANMCSSIHLEDEAFAWMKKHAAKQRKIWLAASTHEGEDEPILIAHKQLLEQDNKSLLILVPRHPERIPQVIQLCREENLNFILHSSGDKISATTQVYLVDTLGELMLFYHCVMVAFVGGSLVPVGGHNVLEPILCDKPVLFGPHVWNFDDICRSLLDVKGAVQIKNSGELMECVRVLLNDEERASSMAAHAKEILKWHRRSLGIHMKEIASLLN